jgi:hypothetical protein
MKQVQQLPKWHVLWALGKKNIFCSDYSHNFIFSPAHANKLVHTDKILTIDQLRAHPKRDQLLNKSQQLGLKYLEEFEEKIPRTEMKQMEVN